MSAEIDPRLPGAELVNAGLAALSRGEPTAEALLVTIAAPRLRRLGIEVPALALDERAEIVLYRQLGAADPRGVHSRYNALIGRVTSCARALERERARRDQSVTLPPKNYRDFR